MRSMTSQRRSSVKTLLTTLILLIPIIGCTTTEVVTSNSKPAMQSNEYIPEDELLDIGIIPFDPNIPADPKEIDKALIVPDVRRAE